MEISAYYLGTLWVTSSQYSPWLGDKVNTMTESTISPSQGLRMPVHVRICTEPTGYKSLYTPGNKGGAQIGTQFPVINGNGVIVTSSRRTTKRPLKSFCGLCNGNDVPAKKKFHNVTITWQSSDAHLCFWHSEILDCVPWVTCSLQRSMHVSWFRCL